MINEQMKASISQHFRGNGWIIFKRLVHDYCTFRKQATQRRQKTIPYVDQESYLHITPEYILHIEALSMSRVTLQRWLNKMHTELAVEGQYFIVALDKLDDRYKMKLNPAFISEKHLGLSKKKPSVSNSDLKNQKANAAFSKLQKKFNKKWHHK